MSAIRIAFLTLFRLTLVAGAIIFVAATLSAQAIKPTACEVDGTEPNKKITALCATYEVFEDRKAQKGRRIPIKIVIFPAKGPKKQPDPLFYIPGGPGSSATEDAPYVAADLGKINETRDLVFVDQRGTGGSNLLYCELFDEKNVFSFLEHWNPPARVRECRKELEKKANLTLYTTSIAMDDLNEVRAGLGYKKINLSGTSYGTRAVMEYVRRHGNTVRAVLLHGVSPADQFMPGEFPFHTQRALDGVLAECLANAECAKAFPRIRDDAAAVLATLKKGPVEVEVKDGEKQVKIKLSRDLAGEAIRYMLYQSGSAGRIPLVLNAAANGDYRPLAEAAVFYRRVIVATGATGLYLSITCAEDLPFAKAATADGGSTFLGNYRLREQLEACAEWPRSPIEKDYSRLTRSNVPALIYSGQWDPVTPPDYGERLSKGLPNSLHIVVPSGGHGFRGLDGLDCINTLTDRFIEQGTVKGLDTACLAKIKRSGFATVLR